MKRTGMPMIAGILNILAGCLSLLGGGLVAWMVTLILYSPDWYWDGVVGVPVLVIWLVFMPYLVISALAIAGGIYSLKRRFWGLTLAGSICALLTIWAGVLGIVSIIMVIAAKREFDNMNSELPAVVSGTARVPPIH
jgi:hypothetical protein